MIHNILIPWSTINLADDLRLKEVKSDTIVLNVTVDELDLSNYKIRCVLCDNCHSVQLGNLLAGGSDAEILAVAAESGMSAFQVTVAKNETTDFSQYVKLEIEIEDTLGRVFTILQQLVTFNDENIDWTIPA